MLVLIVIDRIALPLVPGTFLAMAPFPIAMTIMMRCAVMTRAHDLIERAALFGRKHCFELCGRMASVSQRWLLLGFSPRSFLRGGSGWIVGGLVGSKGCRKIVDQRVVIAGIDDGSPLYHLVDLFRPRGLAQSLL